MDKITGGALYGPRPIGLKFPPAQELPKSIQLNERQLQLLEARRKSQGLLKQGTHGRPPHQYQNPLPPKADDGRRGPVSTKSKHIVAAGDCDLQASTATKDRQADSQTDEHWADHEQLLQASGTAETVPTTWSESSSAVSDAASSSAANESEAESDNFDRAANQFYGQRLKGSAKKLYDDTGATWNESRSEVTVSSSAAASTVISNKSLQQQLENEVQARDDEAKTLSATTHAAKDSKEFDSAVIRTVSSFRDSKGVDIQDSVALRTQSEESVESVEPLHSRSESLADEEPHVPPELSPVRRRPHSSQVQTERQDATRPPRQGVQRNPKFVLKLAKKKEQQEQELSLEKDHDQQRTIVRNLMYKSEGISKSLVTSTRLNKSSEDSPGSEVAAKSNGRSKKGRMSWLNSPSMFHRSPRSGSSGSSGSQGERDVIKRVLERAQRNRVATQNPRKGSYFKSASSRMKGLVSPKHPSSHLRDAENALPHAESYIQETVTPQSSQNRRKEWLQDTIEEESPMTSREGTSPKLNISKIASMAMDDLIETEELDDSDDEEADVLSPKILKARSIKSLPDIVTDDEIEIKISRSSDIEVSTPVKANADGSHDVEENHEVFVDTARKQFSSIEPNANHQDISENDVYQIHEAELDGYPEFINALKCELSNSNSKLYDSFHAMFHDDGRQPQPLTMYPGDLDLKTKETIATMSKQLKSIPEVECVTESQLISDKDVDISKARKVVFGKHLLQATKNGVGLVQYQRVQPAIHPPQTIMEDNNFSDQNTVIVRVPSVDSINRPREDDEFEVTLTQHIRKSSVPPFTSAIEQSRSIDSYTSLAKTCKVGSADSVAPSDDSIFFDSKRKFANHPIKAPSVQPSLPLIPAEKESIPWTSIKLRSVSETNKQGSAEEQIPASWTKIKLRPISKSTLDRNVCTQIESMESAEIHRIVLKTTPKSTSAGSKSFDLAIAPSASTEMSGCDKKPIHFDGQDGKPIKLIETRGTEKVPINVEDTSKGTEKNPIKLSNSVDSLDLNDGSIMVSLSNENGSTGMEMKLLISKQGMLKVEAIPGETRVNVVWRLDRDDIKSALLDMSTFTVKLFVSSGDKDHKDLSFPSSDQCMKFANALHELTNGSNGSRTMNEKCGAEDTVYVEQLSEEEQNVLDEFRQRKHQPGESHENGNILPAEHLLTIKSRPDAFIPTNIVKTNMVGPSSPLSEVSDATPLFSVAQLKQAETYKKMVQMRIPKEAVKHKMIMDQMDPKIIDIVLCGGLPNDPPTGTLSPDDETVADSYKKMLQMMVPADAVLHKMQKDGVEKHIISAVFGHKHEVGELKKSSTSSAPDLSIAEQSVAAMYKKMLKMMIPLEAVEHKMKMDGVDVKIIASVLGSTKSSKISGSSLSDAEESIASAYRKMLKLSIPKESVRHKMKSEGISQKIMNDVLGEKFTSKASQGTSHNGGFKAGGFHWTTIPDDESIAGSVWSKAKPMSETGCEKPEAAIDISKHVEMFQKKPTAQVGEKKAMVKSGSDSKELAKLIDLNRANNVAITLKAFNDFSHKELAQLIEFLDPFGKIKGDRALFMKDLLPAAAEVKAIKGYDGSDDRLVTAEKWFRNILHIKRIEDKIQVMRTIETFKMDAIVLGKSFHLLTDVCNQVMDSDRLPDLLDMVRQIGNRMNEGRGDAAAGFKLDFLPRLAQTKGSDKKTTALDLVVMVFVERGQREALLLSSDFPHCQEASRMQLSDLATDVRNLEAALRKCKKELEQLQKERDSSQSGRPPRARDALDIDSRSEADLLKPLTGPNPRASNIDAQTEAASHSRDFFKERCQFMTASMKQREEFTGNGDSPSLSDVLSAIRKSTKEEKSSLSPRASLLAALAGTNGDKIEFSLEASIRRLEKFVSEVNYVILPKLEAEHAKAIEACKALASFFCESGGEKTASSLLKILDEFSSNIDLAVKKYDEQKAIECRKNASKKRKSLTSSKPPAPETLSTKHLSSSINDQKLPAPESLRIPVGDVDDQGEKKSLVLMVNEMLKVAGDEQIKDFMRGVVYHNPDERLKKIYQAEKSLQSQDSARKDILSTIKQRRQNNRDQDTTQALSELRSKLEEPMSDLVRETEAPANTADRPSRSRVAARWSSTSNTTKRENDHDLVSERCRGETLMRAPRAKNDCVSHEVLLSGDENKIPIEATTDSEILMADSTDQDDVIVRRKRRQSYMDRWASKTPASEASIRDLDEESDVGAFQELLIKTKTRQRYISRWATKPPSSEEMED